MSTSIFYQGDLNSGISRAIQEQKLVACFVRQDDEESTKWENEWLVSTKLGSGDRSLGELLGDKAVILRIEAGSKEATFFNAFCPTTTVPTLAIIHNGQVLARLESGLDQDEFTSKLIETAGIRLDEVDDDDALDTVAAEDDYMHVADVGESTQADQPSPSSETQPSSQIQEVLSERARRLEAERKKREEAEKAERIARAQARRKEAEEASAAHRGDKGKQRATPEKNENQKSREAWIVQQKQRKDEAKKERERILAQIEADKLERRNRAQMAKEAQLGTDDGAFSELRNTDQALPVSKPGTSCSLQVRLFDGSSIRAKFAPDTDIATAVRTWVKEASPAGGADQPYTFRQILAPQPSRSIEVSEEHQTLRELRLVPNATLVLVPVAQYTDAYSSAGGGYVGSAVNGAYSLASSGFSLLGSILSYVPGLGGSATAEPSSQSRGPYMGGMSDEQEPSNIEGARIAQSDSVSPAGPSIRVKTLADQRAEAAKKQGAEFYNGNSLRFEGRDDQDPSKKD